MAQVGTLILCYHRVAEGVEDPFKLCVRPDHFAAHLQEATRRREPSTLADLSTPSRRPRVVVTFDDGYRDNLTEALPIARSMGVPITVFVTSGAVDRSVGFWWDRLATLLRSRPTGVREVHLTRGEEAVSVPVGGSGYRSDLAEVHRHLVDRPVDEIERELEAMAEGWSVEAAAPPDARTLTRQELVRLSEAEMVTVGAHTVDHVRLAGRPRHEQVRSIVDSKRSLEELLGRRVSHFAYPFGRADDFDDESVAAVRSAQFDTACTTIAGTARPATDPHRLPRRMVMDWGRARFRLQLQRWRLG
jgi:peptidoglycan/xylan/chitin deacetylase (PgdA/CDA1 family)